MVGSSCLAREASDPMFAKLQLHLLLQLVQHLHLLQTHFSLVTQASLQLYKIRQTKNVLRTSLTDPEQNHKSCLASITSAPSQHLGKLPDILGKSWPSIIDISAKGNSPTHTVSLMSGMSLPMSAHFVLMSSLKSLACSLGLENRID